MILRNAEFGKNRRKVDYLQLPIISTDCRQKLLIPFLEKWAIFPHVCWYYQLKI